MNGGASMRGAFKAYAFFFFVITKIFKVFMGSNNSKLTVDILLCQQI